MIRFFAGHPTAANLLLVLIVTAGLLALPTLPRETFPEFAPQEVQISAVWPGASAEDTEEAICQRLEDVLDGITDLEEVRCNAMESRAVAVARMADSGDMGRFLDDVKSEVEAIADFPAEVERPVIRQLGRTDHVVSIAVAGPMTPPHLKAYAESLKERLQLLPEISQVTVSGFSQHQFQIRISEERLRAFGLGLADLAAAVGRQSVDLPAGTLEGPERDLLIRFTDQRRSLRELANLVVLADAGLGEIRLGDIAEITDRFEKPEEKILFDGERAALLTVTKNKRQDALVVVDAVRRFVEEERRRAPPGVTLALTRDTSTIVRDRLQMLARNGVQGLLLVFVVMWLFFRFRFAFWVAMGLPVAFLGGLFLMAATGQTINMISMVALLIALGLLMDDAIVIAENIATHLRRGKRALEAAIEGTRQVAPGVFSSFLTTVAVFAPLSLLAGDMGKVLRVIPFALIMVLTTSLIEAFLILPHHLEHSLRGTERQKPGRFRRAFDKRIEWLRHQWLGRVIDRVVHARYLFLGGVVALFLVSIGMLAGGHLKFQAFPDIEGNSVEARLMMPQGTPLAHTEAVVARLLAALDEVNDHFTPLQPEGQSLVRQTRVTFGLNADAGEKGPHLATIAVDLLEAERRKGVMDDYLQMWRERLGVVPDALSITFKEPFIGPGGIPVEVRLQGDDLEELKAAALELREWLAGYRGLLDITDDLRPGKPEVRLRLRDGTLPLGVDAETIARQLRAAFHGSVADELQLGTEDYEIALRLAAADRQTLEDLANLRIVSQDGRQIPLSDLVEIRRGRGYAVIQRIDGLRTVTVTADVDTRLANAREVMRDTRERFLPELLERHPGIRASLEGQEAESARTSGSMARLFGFSLIVIFVLLSFQFRSWIEPLAVMAVIPLAMIGVVWGHLLMGLEISMPSMMGAVSLAGIVVNDSILLVEFLKLRVREGMTVPAAARQASRERFRAVLLTSLTTVAGLMPLLLERSLQAQIVIPLAVSIVFGLLATTAMVLLVVPALFSVFDDMGWVAERPRQEGDFSSSEQ
ncbi:MAG TPA: efflux RND transporter permease subunit [Thiotrichales bacterium]|nr:efflux RND transporter permease subunit [Thiotrichales bacterium]